MSSAFKKRIFIRNSFRTYLTADNLFFLSLMLLTVGLATSNIFMSWGQFGLAFAWLWKREYATRWKLFTRNRQLVMHACIYILFLVGLIYTSDFTYAFHDLKVKLPILVLPLLIGGFSSLSLTRSKWIVHALLITLLVCCCIGLLIYLQVLPWKADNARKYSPFISSIRMGTLLVFGIFICAWLSRPAQKEWRWFTPVIYLLLIALFLFFIILLKSLTGLIALIVAGWVLILVWGWKQKKGIKYTMIAVSVLIPVSVFLFVQKEVRNFYAIEKIDFADLPYSSPNGNLYKHDTTSWQVENGHYVYVYIANWELWQEWNKRSDIDYNGKTTNGWPVRNVLFHFMASKGLKKNAQGMQQLSDEDIRAVERGVTNYRYLKPFRISNRVYEVAGEYYEYSHTGDPNGKSFVMRLEYWKHGWNAVKHRPVFGYGTGDVRTALQDELRRSSALDPRYWINPHQQYLSVALATGIAGLLVFLFLLIFPFVITPRLHYLQWVFLCIMLVAMLDDDPLETQAGVSQISLWYCLLFSVFQLNPSQRGKRIG